MRNVVVDPEYGPDESHPYTSSRIGFRLFNGSTFGELQETSWRFDGSPEDVREFVQQHVWGPEETTDLVLDMQRGTFDVTSESGKTVRVYTERTRRTS